MYIMHHVAQSVFDLHWLKIEERIVYKLLILTFKDFITLYLCEVIEQQKSSTNTRLANDVFPLKLPPPSRNCSNTLLSVPLLMEPHMNGTILMNVSDGCLNINMIKSEINTVLFVRYFNSYHATCYYN